MLNATQLTLNCPVISMGLLNTEILLTLSDSIREAKGLYLMELTYKWEIKLENCLCKMERSVFQIKIKEGIHEAISP